ncbi:MAG: nucleotidyltransferase substrate binding protein [Clostridia bacterium]|nr:nucleotidyltransferase substrate binding protein [Clostridia bacterium]
MKRFEERRTDLNNAVNRLEEALNEEVTDLVIDGILHRFEFSFELSWKTMKDYLEFQGVVNKEGSPREIIKEAFATGVIDNGENWIKMMIARNSLAHLYDEETSREIYDDIKNCYILELKKLVEKFNSITLVEE